MKTFLRFTFILIVATAFTGCYKNDDYLVNPVAGTWVLERAERMDSYGWYTFNSGIEYGLFDFYNNGSAEYNDRPDHFIGNWYINNLNGNYFDVNGNYSNGSHQVMRISVYDSYTNSSINLDFGNVVFYNNHFVATDYYNGSVERYTFRRY